MAVMKRKSLDHPDELREFPLGNGAFSSLGTFTIGRGVLQPGWRWSTHMAPIMGTPSCPIHHLQVVLAGRCRVRMDDGEELEFAMNDLMEIPPGHDIWVVGDEPLVLLDFAGNIGDLAVPREHERVILTLLMTDIVDSTRTASRLGDGAWKQLLTDHNRLVRQQIARFGGHEVNTTGDGFLATFTSAVGALRCALASRNAVQEAGLSIRTGIHTGEWRSSGVTSVASPSTPSRASCRWHRRPKCSSRPLPPAWRMAAAWRSRIVAATRSRACHCRSRCSA